MRKIVDFTLTILSPLSSLPTAWAIYAGITKQPAFPIHPVIAILGALAVIATSINASLLVTDIKTFNQGLRNEAEKKTYSLSSSNAWYILLGCVMAEICLTLVIVVIPGILNYGVLIFPLLTLAGVFAFSVRFDLSGRELRLLVERILLEKKKEQSKAALLSSKKNTAKQSSSKKNTAQQTSRSIAMREQVSCKWGCSLSGTKAAMNAHSSFCAKNPINVKAVR